MGAVLGVIVFIGAVILLVYLRRKATTALTQQVLDRGGHARGKAATREVTTFTANVSAEQVIESVITLVEPAPELPGAFVARVVVLKRTPGIVVFGYGNRLVITFRAVLSVKDIDGGGSAAHYQLLNWRTSNGIVQGLSEMERLANLVRTTASRLGATYALAEADAPADQHLDASPIAQCPECQSTDLGSRFCTDCGADITAASGAAADA